MAAPPPPPRGGMSLYANLLDPKADANASTSGSPGGPKQPDDAKDDGAAAAAAAKKLVDPALRFQPIRRPQVKQAKPKAATGFPRPSPGGNGGTAGAPAPATTPTTKQQQTPLQVQQQQQQQARNTLADWAATEESDFLYATGEKRQRGGRRKKKKKLDSQPMETDWDEVYDPARPTNVEEYLQSDERIREIRDWKAVLYAHRRRRRPSYDSEMESDEDEDSRPAFANQFAPPPSYTSGPPQTSPPVPNSTTGDDAYARRLALSGVAPPPTTSPTPPIPPPPSHAPEPLAPAPPSVSDAVASSGATISRAPVRYEAPPQGGGDPMDVDVEERGDNDDDDEYVPAPAAPPAQGEEDDDGAAARRTNRPGQAGFAERLMSKYGWAKGSGLGADAGGITTALRVQVEKRRRRPDAEGGGFAEPGGRGRIVEAKKGKKQNEYDDGDGRMSEVVVLRDMLEGMADLEAEMEDGLAQEIGEECGERYGRVERLYIDITGRQVFIKFTDQVSALRAVNALRGRIFNGNTIVPKFYDADKFERGVYG